jgi:hypothetical protein
MPRPEESLLGAKDQIQDPGDGNVLTVDDAHRMELVRELLRQHPDVAQVQDLEFREKRIELVQADAAHNLGGAATPMVHAGD